MMILGYIQGIHAIARHSDKVWTLNINGWIIDISFGASQTFILEKANRETMEFTPTHTKSDRHKKAKLKTWLRKYV